MAQLNEFIKGRRPVTFIDLFAGAGGISEGFMQAFTDHNYYAFVTVPTNQIDNFKPTSVSVARVKNLSGGNYWGLRTKMI